MKRKELKIFTTMSFFIAIAVIIVIPLSLFTSIPRELGSFIFILTLVGIPFSIISMFSKESLLKRIFVLIVNLVPISLFGYAIIMDFIDEFFRLAP
ncbi:2-acyl-glycerophospho-ethanolamine acyltransferase [Cytobacillus oceanisediminis]|uniref:2-acyl-glycerophospho-ethanolamine acyltransferase n=1 Tax=Cytobacillus oceanisediminis TaxID=665099 RepID=UPI0011A6B011|nr:2-acyl-glycerophospho-ethanolamine acyltransferase [Cytobacillus oceanisediminis]